MRETKQFVLGILVFVSAACLLAAKKEEKVQHAPLPAKVLAAKTIYIQNDSGYADMADKAYTQLKAWGKYQIVDAKEKAELVLVLAVTSTQREGRSPSWVSVYNSKTGGWTNGTVQTPSTETLNFSQLTLIDSATGEVAWSDRMIWRRKRSATQELIKSLQRRIEEQEKSGPSQQGGT